MNRLKTARAASHSANPPVVADGLANQTLDA
jgi:hypothetical protein